MLRVIKNSPKGAAALGVLLLYLLVRIALPSADAMASIPEADTGVVEPLVPAGFFAEREPHVDQPSARNVSGEVADEPSPQLVETGTIARGTIAIDAALQGDLESLVSKWFQKASSASKGKLTGDGTQISVHVRSLVGSDTLASIQGERILRPASNLKVATSAAALLLLGSWGGGEYQTAFEGKGAISGGVLHGDLVVHAGGDPLVRDGSLGATESRLDEVAEALLAAGVRRIAGDIVLNEGDFLEPGIGPAWPSADQHWNDYCARAAGLTINGGVLVAQVTPGKSGAKASISVHPSPHGLERNYSVSTVSGTTSNVMVGATSSSVTVKGKIGSKLSSVVSDFAHPDPVGMFGTVLKDRITRANIQVDGGVVRRRGPPPGENILYMLTSPVLDSLVPINTHSNNGVADQLFFTLGHRIAGAGTREGGSEAIAKALALAGVDGAGLVQVDGSGLSRDNRISPSQLTALLQAVLKGLPNSDPVSQTFLNSLAVMGETGKLAKRMRGTLGEGHVFAKTGFIDGTSSLSGIAITPDGYGVIFSIIVNYPTLGSLNNVAWKPMQDEMVLRMLELKF